MATASRVEAFRRLHGAPIRLPNAWDATSARLFERAGARAIGTTSAGIASANGYPDGERMPWDGVGRRVAAEIVQAVALPVSVDIESGYGAHPDAVAATVEDVIAMGAAGINLEDSLPETGALRDPLSAAERIWAARHAGRPGAGFFINARCDVFLAGPLTADAIEDALARARAYIEAGADGIFLPGLLDLPALGAIATALSVPVNVMVGPGAPPIDRLVEAGARRFSQGVWAYRAMTEEVERLATGFISAGAYGP
jgi:2-methylisocitrate lyase-like PEP mutase family enzyme